MTTFLFKFDIICNTDCTTFTVALAMTTMLLLLVLLLWLFIITIPMMMMMERSWHPAYSSTQLSVHDYGLLCAG